MALEEEFFGFVVSHLRDAAGVIIHTHTNFQSADAFVEAVEIKAQGCFEVNTRLKFEFVPAFCKTRTAGNFSWCKEEDAVFGIILNVSA